MYHIAYTVRAIYLDANYGYLTLYFASVVSH